MSAHVLLNLLAIFHGTSENADIFTTRDEIYLVFAEISKYSFYFKLDRNTESPT